MTPLRQGDRHIYLVLLKLVNAKMDLFRIPPDRLIRMAPAGTLRWVRRAKDPRGPLRSFFAALCLQWDNRPSLTADGLMANIEETLGVTFLGGYGLTEVSSAAAISPRNGERRVGSIGLRFAHQDMKVVKLDQDGRMQTDSDANEVGTLVIRV